MNASLIFLIVCALSGDGAEPSVRFKITTKKKDDRVEVRVDKSSALFTIKSPFGISQAVIEREGEKWPDTVALRLHLKGLESFRVNNGKIRLDASVTSHDGKIRARWWKDGKEDALLDEKNPLWPALRIVDGDDKPAQALPLKNGYFEITLPRAFFEGNPKSVTLNWIDFHR